MTDDPTSDARPLALLLLAAAVGLVLFVPTASAQDVSCTELLENRSGVPNASSAPGGLLADAIGDQRDEIGNELDDGFEARLDNATSARERTNVIAEEVERIEANVSTIERCWGPTGPNRSPTGASTNSTRVSARRWKTTRRRSATASTRRGPRPTGSPGRCASGTTSTTGG